MSGASNISCSCSMSSIMRSTSIPSQYLTERLQRSNRSCISKDRDCAISKSIRPHHLPQVTAPSATIRVRCHNVVNGFGATNSFSRHHPANPTGADRHNRMDECGGCGITLRRVAGRSPALLAFGGDSAIELFSAVVVLWRFRARAAHENAERRAARVAGALLFALAAYVAITSVASLLGYSEPKPTILGIAILVAAAVVMPWLAKEKRRLSELRAVLR